MQLFSLMRDLLRLVPILEILRLIHILADHALRGMRRLIRTLKSRLLPLGAVFQGLVNVLPSRIKVL